MKSINISPIRPYLIRGNWFSISLLSDLAFNWDETNDFSLGYRVGALAELNFPTKFNGVFRQDRFKLLLGGQFHDFEVNSNSLPNMIGLKLGFSYKFLYTR